MTGVFLLDWMILTVSLFNTIALMWLGLTVILNAERRTLGLWIAGGELLLGSAFFLSHTVIVSQGMPFLSQSIDFWWRVGWFPVVILPYAWYGVMLWYAGFWEEHTSLLWQRHRLWFIGMSALAVLVVVMLFFANPLPSLTRISTTALEATPGLWGVPLLVWIYPLYILTCIGLSIDVLRNPKPSGRLMGDIARQRAMPWLLAASVLLVVMSLLVGWIMFWVTYNAGQRAFETGNAYTVAIFDLIIAILITITIFLVGQAIVSYELFTGKSLPRSGLRRYWQRVLVLAVGYSAIVAWGITLPLRPIYILLMSIVLMIVFYALVSWRTFRERERLIANLRPLVVSPNFYEQILKGPRQVTLQPQIRSAFIAMGVNFLGARQASLVPLGSLAPLIGSGLSFPEDWSPLPASAVTSLSQNHSADALCWPLDPNNYADAHWAVPLWSERGLIGILVLGDKLDGGLYSQEEIEIAQSIGERLVDTLSSAEIARRLAYLQRQRVRENQLVDHQTRRILHDDILPQIHAVLLAINESTGIPDVERSEILVNLGEVHHRIADLLREIAVMPSTQLDQLGLVGALQQLIKIELVGAFDQVVWQISPRAEIALQTVPGVMAEVLYYAAREALRNAARYGQAAHSVMCVSLGWQNGIEFILEHNAGGINQSQVSPWGSGQGLSLHSALMAVFGGSLSFESVPGKSTRVTLVLPREAWEMASA